MYTNPPSDAIMFDCDAVYCLALEQPDDSEGAASRKERERKRRRMTSRDVEDMLAKAREKRLAREASSPNLGPVNERVVPAAAASE